MNSSKASESAAAQNMRQHSFGLIVSRMRHSNFVQIMFASALRKKSVTQSPRRSLQISLVILGDGFYRGSGGVKWQLIFARQTANKFFVAISCGPAKFVIEMQHAQSNPQL